jgi:hypothetical protein
MITRIEEPLPMMLLSDPSPATLLEWIHHLLDEELTVAVPQVEQAIAELWRRRTVDSRTVLHQDLECALRSGVVCDAHQLSSSNWMVTVEGGDKEGLRLSVTVVVTDIVFRVPLKYTGFVPLRA